MINLAGLQKKQTLAPFRYEIKLPLDRGQLEDFIPRLYGLGLFPRTPFPNRRINSVYCDTTGFRDYLDNVSGIGARRKTRLRWYNGDLSQLTLEQKIKNNKASRKENNKLDNTERIPPHTRRGIKDILERNDSAQARAVLSGVRPVLEVQYDRQYFTLAHDLRMTIDRNQKFRRLYPVPMSYFVDSPVFAVVEFKYKATERARMQAMLRDLPYRVFRHSKYVIGIDCTGQ